MTGDARLMIRLSVAVAAGIALLAIGAGTAYLFTLRGHDERPSAATAAPAAPPGEASAPAAARGQHGDITIPLTPEAVARAGIVTVPVSIGAAESTLRLPGVVEPNAYRSVVVTPLVAGRVTRVEVELGDRVIRGQPLAQVYSPELAEAQTRYISLRAALEAHDRELARAEKLVEIGAASRQELERIHAEHAAQTAEVQSARARLELLGVKAASLDAKGPGDAVNATTTVPAPMAGTVTERRANAGLNVDTGATLFTVVDLSSVWVVADLYERDFARVRIGSPATVTTPAYPDLAIQGRVSYIDPLVNPETRTARVRIEVPNPRLELRLGMFAEVDVTGSGTNDVILVPHAAVQNVGDRTVVYLAHPDRPGTFTEREVSLGRQSGDQVEVRSGVQPGDVIVSEGSFFVRAERERLGLKAPARPAGSNPPGDLHGNAGAGLQSVTVSIAEQGFEPARVTLRAGIPARITFVRTTDKTCGTEVVVPSLDIRRALPLNERVAVEFTPGQEGEIAFSCGMDMLRGAIVVEPPRN